MNPTVTLTSPRLDTGLWHLVASAFHAEGNRKKCGSFDLRILSPTPTAPSLALGSVGPGSLLKEWAKHGEYSPHLHREALQKRSAVFLFEPASIRKLSVCRQLYSSYALAWPRKVRAVQHSKSSFKRFCQDTADAEVLRERT